MSKKILKAVLAAMSLSLMLTACSPKEAPKEPQKEVTGSEVENHPENTAADNENDGNLADREVKTYENEKLGIRMYYPAKWKDAEVSSETPTETNVRISTDDIQVRLTVKTIPADLKTPENAEKSYVANLKTTGIKIDKSAKAELSGLNGYKINAAGGNEQEAPYKIITYIVYSPKFSYTLEFNILASNYDIVKDKVDMMINSIELGE